MAQHEYSDVPKMNVTKYGSVLIEDQVVPCCIGINGMIYVPVSGVCTVLQISVEQETARIYESASLRKGMADVPFQVIKSDREPTETVYYYAISITRLHSWLMQIPAELVPNDELRSRLTAMQDRLAEVVYAYLGRPLLPEEFRDTMERGVPEETRQLYEAISKISDLQSELSVTKESLEAVSGRVKILEVALSLGSPTGSFIDHRQQEVYRQIIGIVGQLYEKRHPGEFGKVEARLKEQFDFVFYKVIKSEQWEGVIRSLIQTYKSLVPAGTPLPQIFNDALKLKTQSSTDKRQPGLFS